MQRDFKTFCVGICMGAADVVPGVSGGTIAFVAGIYQELLATLRSMTPARLLTLKQNGLKAFLKEINARFLLFLALGMGISILSLSRLVLFLLDRYPIFIWSFFTGLILGSVFYVASQVNSVKLPSLFTFVLGIVLAYQISILTPKNFDPGLLTVFLSGSVAICAMILPGISGSFILLLLGMYNPIFSAIRDFNLQVILIFGLGCATGLLSFSHLLTFLFRRYRDLTLYLLTGFMLGSLGKVWPWKIGIEFTQNRHGETIPLVEKNLFPAAFEQLTGENAYFLYSIFFAILGAFIILIFSKVNSNAK